ncbi:hypothetical protein ENUP19_0057G0054 [Entamoeba nuttalli]|uniref:Axoneme associated protein n=2 Tax=Entamoeba nuttalli TaxID=412467 RepID=K2GQA6_ENTNP|nr:hypothetical protein ENU1_210540 [Entamoeba nuttalli P19]EKE37083.1 hypothetical protein ENU1_210540 [Entamoeba nuttalli P19]|eukprot:XP_008860593.1 hypothetical protein ENU1_210540 [Entamoeba nuttalli P19]
MKAFIIVLIALCVSADVSVSGNWVKGLYEAKQQLSLLDTKYEEILDVERQIHDKIDHAQLDYENALPSAKSEIAEKMSEMKSQIVSLHARKTRIIGVMKKILNKFPAEYKERLIREVHLEQRFNPVDDLLTSTLKMSSKKAVKKAVKKALKAALL